MKWLMFPLLVLFALPALAQTAGIAVIDSQRIGRDSAMGKKVSAEVEKLAKQREDEITKRKVSIQELEKKLQNADIMKTETGERDALQLQKLKTELQRYSADSETELKREYVKALNKLRAQVNPLIKKIGDEKGYSIIIDREQTVYFNAKVDITDELIKLLDASTASATPPKKQ